MNRTLISIDQERLAWQRKRKILETQFDVNIRHMSDITIEGYRIAISDCTAKINELYEETVTISKPN